MFDLKISGIAGGGAFLLSLLLGFFSGAAIAVILLRALIFGVVFFVIATGGYFLLSRFLPELLDGSGGSRSNRGNPGSLVNISLDDGAGFSGGPVPGGGGAGFSDGDDLGDISSLIAAPGPAETGDVPRQEDRDVPLAGTPAGLFEVPAEQAPGQASAGGLDQNNQDGYTAEGKEGDPFGDDALPVWEPEPLPPADTTAAPRQEAPVPEFSGTEEALPDLDAMAGAFSGAEGEIPAEPVEKPAGRKPSAGGKPVKLDGDFDPKDLAAAIRDRLKRE